MEDVAICLTDEDTRTGLAIWRELQRAHDLYHVAENDWTRWCAQMAEFYRVPPGWQLTNLVQGFKPQEDSHD
jgi:hypothetical protein